MDNHFNSIFSKFNSYSDKYGSLYIFIIRNLPVEHVTEKIKKMISITDDITNSVKKNYIKTRLNNFINYLDSHKPLSIINSIFLLSKKVDEFEFSQSWTETLDMFKCDNFTVKYGDEFPLSWLHDYLTDKSYLNVLHIQNNNIKHLFLNSTKRVINSEYSEKKCDLTDFISQHIPKSEYCCVHGISSFIKQLKETSTIKILNGNKRDSELLSEYEKILNNIKSQELQHWIDIMGNSDNKDSAKIIFGSEITQAINDNMLHTLYCSPRIKKNVIEKIPSENLIFKIVEIKSYESTDIGKRLRDDFKGSIGIKFY